MKKISILCFFIKNNMFSYIDMKRKKFCYSERNYRILFSNQLNDLLFNLKSIANRIH